jgi:hypothetical protein
VYTTVAPGLAVVGETLMVLLTLARVASGNPSSRPHSSTYCSAAAQPLSRRAKGGAVGENQETGKRDLNRQVVFINRTKRLTKRKTRTNKNGYTPTGIPVTNLVYLADHPIVKTQFLRIKPINTLNHMIIMTDLLFVK